MTDFLSRAPNVAAMAQAARLTRAGRLDEATALIQRSLAGQPPSAPAPHAATARAGGDTAHERLLPDGVRGLIDQIKRGVAPVLKGLAGWEPSHPEAPGPSEPRREVRKESRKAPPTGTPPEPGTGGRFLERSFSNASGARDYKLFVPDASGARPLIVMLHGCTQTPEDFASGTRMNELAAEEGFYVAYPRQTRGANAQKCWNWFQPQDQEREGGEAGIIAGITRAIMAEHAIDPARVYIAGLSAGGAAAANVAHAYPELYAAVGIHSGLAAGCARDLPSALMAMNSGAPGLAMPGASRRFGAASGPEAVRIPTIVFHGDGDRTVNPRNGDQILAQAGIARLEAHPTAGGNGIGHGYLRTRYTDAAGEVQVESWLVRGGGHAWSGGSREGTHTDPAGPDASRAMVDFFRRHALKPVN